MQPFFFGHWTSPRQTSPGFRSVYVVHPPVFRWRMNKLHIEPYVAVSRFITGQGLGRDQITTPCHEARRLDGHVHLSVAADQESLIYLPGASPAQNAAVMPSAPIAAHGRGRRNHRSGVWLPAHWQWYRLGSGPAGWGWVAGTRPAMTERESAMTKRAWRREGMQPQIVMAGRVPATHAPADVQPPRRAPPAGGGWPEHVQP